MNRIALAMNWTVWAIGWMRVKAVNGKTIEVRVFVGPMVIKFW